MPSSSRALAALATLALAHPLLARPAEPDPQAKELAAMLQGIVQSSALSSARAGILVARVDTGEVIFAHDPDALLNPASNVKLVTTAAALARLGPEFRFSTEFLVDGGARGEVKTLAVRGKGDPTLVTERLWAIAGDLWHLGVRRIGELVLDEGYFDGERIGPGFDQEDGDRAYLAPAGALSLNFNSVEAHVAPGDRVGGRARVELEPESDYLSLDNRTATVARNGRGRVKVSTEPRAGKERVVVEGRVPAGGRPQVLWRRVDDPALYLGQTLKALLELRGMKVGRVRVGAAPPGARLLYVSQSDPLAEVIRKLNKTSNNFTAEQLFKTLGAEVKGAPGTWPKGVEACADFLAEVGVPRGTYVMKNGSGLNDTNRFSARQLVAVLRAMWARFPLQPEYVVSLPVAARDGTIRWRMEGTEAAGRLRAKTGTLEGVTSLSGYVQTAGGKVLAFAVLVNDSPGRQQIVRGIDALGAAMAASGAPEGAAYGVAAAGQDGGAVRPAVAAAPADLSQTVKTYYALGRTADPRNEPFLRTALRSESDTAVRLAVAEAVYLSDPDGDTARRTFLEALAADPPAVGRLWAALPDDADGPVVSSLADLAADGEGDALRRLVELSGAAWPDAKLGPALADALVGVADSAPDELLAALRAAPPAVGTAASARLADGMARSDEKDHPLTGALRAAADRQDAGGEQARALLGALHLSDAPQPPRMGPVPEKAKGKK
jgi:D-alanyl-D-alanine carboxypeptidase/D-alanyl-D-alanine-endopeptidase (penicillin-binding protein 4)